MKANLSNTDRAIQNPRITKKAKNENITKLATKTEPANKDEDSGPAVIVAVSARPKVDSLGKPQEKATYTQAEVREKAMAFINSPFSTPEEKEALTNALADREAELSAEKV